MGLKSIYPLMGLLLLLLLPSCTTVHKPPIKEPLGEQTVKNILAAIQEQEDKVFSFYAHGRLLAGNWYGQSEANILTAGTKRPFKIKIEITQEWGQPILHVLIDQKRLEVLSFKDKTLFLAPFTSEALSEFLPGNIDPEFIWGTLRGYPNLIVYDEARSLRKDQISLFHGGDEAVEVIDLDPETHLPKSVLFPDKQITLTFADFQNDEGIRYSREVSESQKGEKRRITLKDMTFVFNKPIPEAIFSQKKPPTFETRYLGHTLPPPNP
jgi:hypothetical protein